MSEPTKCTNGCLYKCHLGQEIKLNKPNFFIVQHINLHFFYSAIFRKIVNWFSNALKNFLLEVSYNKALRKNERCRLTICLPIYGLNFFRTSQKLSFVKEKGFWKVANKITIIFSLRFNATLIMKVNRNGNLSK